MKKLFAALVCLLVIAAPAYAQNTKAQMITEVNTNWPNNTSGLITPTLLRSTIIDLINSYVDVLSFGYSPSGQGVGGAVTQLTTRITGVTLNKASGAITLVSTAGSATPQTFVVSSNKVAATDTISLSQKSGTNLYELFPTAVVSGAFNITFFTTGGTATDAPVINFNIIKGVAD